MLSRKTFENLHAVVAILMPFEEFSGKFCLNFSTLCCDSECFAKYHAFCSHIFDYACLRRKAYCCRRGSKLWKKLYTSKAFLKIAGGRMHTPHPTPLAISCRNHQKSLAYFGHFAPLIFFFLTKRQSRKGRGHGPMPPPLNTLLYRNTMRFHLAPFTLIQSHPILFSP